MRWSSESEADAIEMYEYVPHGGVSAPDFRPKKSHAGRA